MEDLTRSEGVGEGGAAATTVSTPPSPGGQPGQAGAAPPAPVVPLAALHEERTKRQQIEAQLEAWKPILDQLQQYGTNAEEVMAQLNQQPGSVGWEPGYGQESPPQPPGYRQLQKEVAELRAEREAARRQRELETNAQQARQGLEAAVGTLAEEHPALKDPKTLKAAVKYVIGGLTENANQPLGELVTEFLSQAGDVTEKIKQLVKVKQSQARSATEAGSGSPLPPSQEPPITRLNDPRLLERGTRALEGAET